MEEDRSDFDSSHTALVEVWRMDWRVEAEGREITQQVGVVVP